MDNYNFIRTETVQRPTEPLLTLDEVKAHLRVDSDYEDDYIASLVSVATDEAEEVTRRRFGDQIVNAYFEHWRPVTLYKCGVVQDIELYMRDESGDWVLIEPDKYELIRAVPAFIQYHDNFSEPTHKNWYELVKVSVSCGEPLPATVRHWMLLRIGTLYDNRQSDAERPSKPQEFATELLNIHKIIDF